ncbi:MAG: hypothetical protein PHS93_08885 [Candidatus Omnitrophica bacterium]|nr:hypothetical protein [Candidatus Omnitrophota bacterium]
MKLDKKDMEFLKEYDVRTNGKSHFETFEALQQEIQQLQIKMLLGVVNSDLVKTYDGSALDRADQYIERLELENGKLQAQVAATLGQLKSSDYEVSGLSPEEVQEIAQAKAEGRLVVLPCKVGDTVYALQSKRISEFCVDPLHKEIVVAKIIEITLKDGITWLRLYSTDDRIADYKGDSFGKTVFLTREAADKQIGDGE